MQGNGCTPHGKRANLRTLPGPRNGKSGTAIFGSFLESAYARTECLSSADKTRRKWRAITTECKRLTDGGRCRLNEWGNCVIQVDDCTVLESTTSTLYHSNHHHPLDPDATHQSNNSPRRTSPTLKNGTRGWQTHKAFSMLPRQTNQPLNKGIVTRGCERIRSGQAGSVG